MVLDQRKYWFPNNLISETLKASAGDVKVGKVCGQDIAKLHELADAESYSLETR